MRLREVAELVPLERLVRQEALQEHLMLRPKGVIEALPLDARGIHEFLNRGGFVPPLSEQVHGGIESLVLIELLCTRHCLVIPILERMVEYLRQVQFGDSGRRRLVTRFATAMS